MSIQSTPQPNEIKNKINSAAASGQTEWDRHWQSLGQGNSRSLFGFASSAVRHLIFQPAVRFFLEKYFPSEGLFIEAGCGTGESSANVTRRNRKFIGLDFSMQALKQAQSTACFDALMCADLFHLPFDAESIDGIWNLGVMEHFEYPALNRSLNEFRRVLKPGGVIVLFWPAERNLSRWILSPVEFLRSTFTRRQFRFFPDEVSRLKSRQEAAIFLKEVGCDVLEVDFSARTAFIHMVVVGRKN